MRIKLKYDPIFLFINKHFKLFDFILFKIFTIR